MGVRYLDVRVRHVNDSFSVHHGKVYQKHRFGRVLKDVDDFLRDNPTETIIMSVKSEHTGAGNTRSFEKTFDWYVAGSYANHRWYLGTTVPKLGEVRGKIVLLRRFGAKSAKGIDLSDWQNPGAVVRIQDNYKVRTPTKKWNSITPMLEDALNGPFYILYMNFASAYTGDVIPDIKGVSKFINPWMSKHLDSFGAGRLGVLSFDHIYPELSLQVVNANFVDVVPKGTYAIQNYATKGYIDIAYSSKDNGASALSWGLPRWEKPEISVASFRW